LLARADEFLEKNGLKAWIFSNQKLCRGLPLRSDEIGSGYYSEEGGNEGETKQSLPLEGWIKYFIEEMLGSSNALQYPVSRGAIVKTEPKREPRKL
jgi:hypothetical protein